MVEVGEWQSQPCLGPGFWRVHNTFLDFREYPNVGTCPQTRRRSFSLGDSEKWTLGGRTAMLETHRTKALSLGGEIPARAAAGQGPVPGLAAAAAVAVGAAAAAAAGGDRGDHHSLAADGSSHMSHRLAAVGAGAGSCGPHSGSTTEIEEQGPDTPGSLSQDEEAHPTVSGTTVVVRNFACRYTHEDVANLLNEMGLRYNFLYVPTRRQGGKMNNRGFAFVGFSHPSEAERCRASLSGQRLGSARTPKRVHVEVAKVPWTEIAFHIAQVAPPNRDADAPHEEVDSLGKQTPVTAYGRRQRRNERAACPSRGAGRLRGEGQPRGSAAQGAEQAPTTVMLRNIACRHTPGDVASLLDGIGFVGSYNFVLMPTSYRRGKSWNRGYAFVDFKDASDVDRCRELLSGLKLGTSGTTKRIEVALATHQRAEMIPLVSNNNSDKCFIADPNFAGNFGVPAHWRSS